MAVYLHGKRDQKRPYLVSTPMSLGITFVPVVIFLVIVVFLFVVFFVRFFPEEQVGGFRAIPRVSVKIV